MGREIEFLRDDKGDDNDDRKVFEMKLDDWLTAYMIYKTFGHDMGRHKNIDKYESIWEFLHEKIEEYVGENSDIMRLTSEDDSDSDSDEEESKEEVKITNQSIVCNTLVCHKF